MMTPIWDYDGYNDKMSKSMLDKLSFLSHVDADIFVDFGCADGAMIRAMTKMFPDHLYIGYDNDPNMIESAKWLQESHRNIFLSDWNEVIKELSSCKSWYHKRPKSCLILSSVVHEVFSYENKDGIEEFYQRAFNSGFDYIAIRDMSLTFARSSEKNTISPFFVDMIYKTADSGQVADFENIWGKLSLRNNAIHFLLKYKYKENWEREVRENYFSYDLDNLTSTAYNSGYSSSYFERFSIPFIRRQIQEDFGFVLKEPTHYKLILEKK